MSGDPGGNPVVPTYEVVLLYASMPPIQQEPLLAALLDRCGTVEPVEGTASTFRFPDLVPPDGGEPAGFTLKIRNAPLPEAEAEEAILQTRDWPQARAAFQRHRAYVKVADRAAAIPYKNRLRIFQDILLSLAGLAAPLAILWKPSGKLVSPMTLAKTRDGRPDPLLAAVNIRFGPAPDGSGDRFMDTLGLAALGLPDLECIVQDEEPSRMAAWLRALARYLYDLGDVLDEGRPVKGPDGKSRWICTNARSADTPDRAVYRLAPAPAEGGPPRGGTVRFEA